MALEVLYSFVAALSVTGLLLRSVLFGCIFYVAYRTAIYPFFLSPFRRLPTPHDVSVILGSGRSMFKQPPGVEFHKWMKTVPNDGLILVRSFFNFKSRLLATSPAALQEILVTKPYDFVKPPEARAFLAKVLGDGLVVVEGAEHKFQRKKLTPAFQGKHIKDLYPLFWSKSNELIDYIKAGVHTGEDVIEMHRWASRATLDIIGVAALGRNFESLKDPNGRIVKQYEYISEPSNAKLIYFVLNMTLPRLLADNLPTKTRQRMDDATAALRVMCRQLLADKKALEKTESERNVDILSVLLRTESFSDEQLIDQLLTFLAAGHDTTSASLTWSMYLLAINPHMQDRLRAEIRQYIPHPDPSTEITFDTIDKMVYLNGVCNETLRLYPTVPMSVRQAARDTSVLGVPVPKDTPILLCMWAINRLTSIWGPDGEIFKPERWIPTGSAGEGDAYNRGGSNSIFGLLTFLHGPRSCIGQGFARAEMKCLLAALVGNFTFELADKTAEIVPTGAITIKPKGGLHLRLKPVKY